MFNVQMNAVIDADSPEQAVLQALRLPLSAMTVRVASHDHINFKELPGFELWLQAQQAEALRIHHFGTREQQKAQQAEGLNTIADIAEAFNFGELSASLK